VVQIVAGDTLLALAIAHNTTTEEIVALNPGIQPNLLQIGQPVILPPPATPLAQLVGGTAVPLQMAVQQVHIYPTPVGSAWVVGELLNEGSQAVEGVQVTIDVQNGAGVVVATVMAWAALPIVQPEQRTPFAVLIAELPAEELFPVVTVSGGQSVVDLGSRYLDVAVSETAVQSEGDVATVQATVTNVGTEAAWVMVVAALYDAQGQIAGYTQVALPTPLAVGEKQQVRWQTAVPGALGETAVLTPFGQRLIAP
jgi:LysM repeat protein